MKVPQIHQGQVQQKQNHLIKKRSILKSKNRISVLFNFPFMFKFSEPLYESLKELDQTNFEEISTLPKVFYFKTMKNATFDNEKVVLQLKTIKQKIKPIQQYVKMFKEFGDSFLYKHVVSYQFIYDHLFKLSSDDKKAHHQIMENLLQNKLKGKMYLSYMMEKQQSQTCLSKIFISRELIKATRYSVQNMQMDYLKFKHIFFEIVSREFFQKVQAEFGHYAKKFLDNSLQKNQEDPHKINLIIFQDFVYRKSTIANQNGQIDQCQQKLHALIQYYKPHPKITVFQFHIDEQNIIEVVQKMKTTQLKQKLQNQIQNQQKDCLSHILQT